MFSSLNMLCSFLLLFSRTCFRKDEKEQGRKIVLNPLNHFKNLNFRAYQLLLWVIWAQSFLEFVYLPSKILIKFYCVIIPRLLLSESLEYYGHSSSMYKVLCLITQPHRGVVRCVKKIMIKKSQVSTVIPLLLCFLKIWFLRAIFYQPSCILIYIEVFIYYCC